MSSVEDVPPLSRVPLTGELPAIGGNSGSARGSLAALAGTDRLHVREGPVREGDAREGPVTRQGDDGGGTGWVGEPGGESAATSIEYD